MKLLALHHLHRYIFSGFQVDTFGIGNILARRVGNHIDTLVWNLDKVFFTAAAAAATAVTPTGTTLPDKLELLIQTAESTQNQFVRGVGRNQLELICSPQYYGQIRNYLDTVPNPNVDTVAESFGIYHGVKVYSTINIPTGVSAILEVNGAVALPVVFDQYNEPERIQLSNDYAVSLFYKYGVKALTPDLIFKLAAA